MLPVGAGVASVQKGNICIGTKEQDPDDPINPIILLHHTLNLFQIAQQNL